MCPLHGENIRDPDLSTIEEINAPTKFSVSRNFSRATSRAKISGTPALGEGLARRRQRGSFQVENALKLREVRVRTTPSREDAPKFPG